MPNNEFEPGVWDGVEYQVLSASLKYSYQSNCTTHIREALRKKICEYLGIFPNKGGGFSSIPEHRPPLVRLQKEQESYCQSHQRFTIGLHQHNTITVKANNICFTYLLAPTGALIVIVCYYWSAGNFFRF